MSPHLLDTGRLSWGVEEEYVYTCPCGDWQLHVPKDLAMAFAARSITDGDVMRWVMDGIRILNRAIDDALWEHESACPVLQHRATQAGVVRREPFHPYVWTPNEYEARYDMLHEASGRDAE